MRAPRRAALLPALAAAVLPLAYFWRGLSGQVLLAEGDGLAIFFPMRRLFAEQLLRGELPLWNPFVFGGMPFLGALQTAMLYPLTWLFLVLPPLAAMNALIIATYVGTTLATYAYARVIGCSRFAAAFAGIAFGLGGFMLAHVGNVSPLQAMPLLPLLLLSLERSRHRHAWRDVVCGAAVVALLLFAGHPQLPAYNLMAGALYVLYFGVAHRPPVGRRRYLLAAVTMLAAGVLLSAIQLLPGIELALQSVRAQMTYEEFVDFALPAAQLPMLLFPFLFGGWQGPYWGTGFFLEVTAYPGLVPLALAAAAACRVRADPMVRFWVLLAAWTLALALGDSLPLARLMYHVPVYDLFRAADRNLASFGLATAVLAALELSAPPSPARSRRLRLAAAVLLLAALAIATLAAWRGAELWGGFAPRVDAGLPPRPWRFSLAATSPSVYVPVLLSGAVALALWRLARLPGRTALALVLAVHLVDSSLFWRVLAVSFPPAAAATSRHPAVRYLNQVAPAPDARALFTAAGGGAVLSLEPAMWGVALVNGYDAVPLQRYTRFAGGMHYWGAVSEAALVRGPRFLDLLNTRYLVIGLPRYRTFVVRHDGVEFAAEPLGATLHPGEAIEFTLPLPRRIDAVAAVSALGTAVDVAQGEPVLRMTLRGTDGAVCEVLWRAGLETAEWAWERPDVRPVVAHRQAAIAETTGGAAPGARYLGVVALDQPCDVASLRIEYIGARGALELSRLTLRDRGAKVDYLISQVFTLLNDNARWQRRFTDASAVVLENTDALPRAWLVPRTVQLDAPAVLDAVDTGVLPDGTPFDPRALALVEDAPGQTFGAADPQATAEIAAYAANHLAVRTRSAQPAFLVLSEIFFPGWYATVDGAPAPLQRADYVLRGVPIPAGEHRVELVYAPRSVAIGAAISLATAVALLAISAWRWRVRRAVASPHASVAAEPGPEGATD